MSLQIVFEGENHFILDTLFGALSVRNLTLRLFTNDITPGNADTEASYTEADTGWTYAAKTLTRGSWSITGGSGSTKSYCSYAEQSFTFAGYTGSDDYVYGYYITFDDGGTERLLGAERLPSRQLISAALTLSITPKIELSDLAA